MNKLFLVGGIVALLYSFSLPSGLITRTTSSSKELTFVTLSHGKVHYKLSGTISDPSSPLIVLVHGFSVATYCYDELAHGITEAGKARVLQFDLYGRGYSDSPDVPNSPSLFVGQIAELLFALDSSLGHVEKIDLVGYSMGGAIAASFAALYPEKIRSLALFAPAGLPGTLPVVAKFVHLPFLPDILFLYGREWGTRTGLAKEWVDTKSNLERYARVMTYLLADISENPYGGTRSLLSTLRHFSLDDTIDAYKFVGSSTDFPVTVFWGTKDDVCPYDNHRALKAFIPRIEVHSVDDMKHALFVERLDLVFPTLSAFWQKIWAGEK